MGEVVLGIDLEGGLADVAAFLPVADFGEGEDAEAEKLEIPRAELADEGEVFEGFWRVVFFNGDVRTDHVDGSGARFVEGGEGGLGRGVGLVEQAEAELAAGKHLCPIGAIWAGVMDFLKQRESCGEAAGVHVGAGHVPGVFPEGF